MEASRIDQNREQSDACIDKGMEDLPRWAASALGHRAANQGARISGQTKQSQIPIGKLSVSNMAQKNFFQTTEYGVQSIRLVGGTERWYWNSGLCRGPFSGSNFLLCRVALPGTDSEVPVGAQLRRFADESSGSNRMVQNTRPVRVRVSSFSLLRLQAAAMRGSASILVFRGFVR